MHRKVLKEDVLATIEEARKYEVAGLRRHVEVHKMNMNDATIEEMLSWSRRARVFKRRVTKSVTQDTRNVMSARVN